MRVLRIVVWAFLAATVLTSLSAGRLAPYDYAMQFRDHASEAPSHAFPLGTDELGRDRLSRLLYGSRISLICASLAAAVAAAIAAAVGVFAGYVGGWPDEFVRALIDVFLSLPWLFALLTARALLPLNAASWASVAVTFLLLAVVGWPPGARVIRASVASIRNSGAMVHARAYGCSRPRLLWLHVLPNVKPIIAAQFWILVPVFLLAEANLGVLGLGVSEPMPSWGNMLAELQHYERIPESPWILAPAVLLILVIASLHFVVSGRSTWE